jgi:hypothetical protein
MKKLILSFLIILLTHNSFIIFSQSEDEINWIKKKYQIINSMKFRVLTDVWHYDMYKKYYLYTKKDTLYKITEKGFSDNSYFITEYYFWDEKLIFVYDANWDCPSWTRKDSSFIDYSKKKLYENRYYFKNEKLIKFIGEEQYKELENILSTAADEKEKTKELLKKK